MEYNFKEVEKKWQSYWQENKTYRVEVDPSKPKYYVLDMFPYPSGAGLHVGHPLGYIASDIYSRYKHLKGFNVLHPMGYDAYGLPAEQYAIQTGQHPAITTEKNIRRYREQMDKIGFSFDWDREIRTCDPKYYKWTQWTFIQMFNSFYCYDKQKALPITELVKAFETVGTQGLNVACGEELNFTAEEWKNKSTKEQQEILLNYRLAYLADTMVNWCPQLGTVLANDEVKAQFDVSNMHIVMMDRDMDSKQKKKMMEEIGNVKGVKSTISMSSLLGPTIPESMIPENLRSMLQSDEYELAFVSSEYESATDEVNEQVKAIDKIVKSYDKNGMVIGEAPLMKDLQDVTDADLVNVNVLSIGAIFIIILLIFKSISLPIILVAVIEFAIMLNMAIPYYQGTSLPFVASIVIGAIQLGATVDYAILMTTRYQKERQNGKDKKEAISIAHKTSMPSIISSGLSFFAATFGVACYSQVEMIGSICTLLARGAIISMVVVILILPAMFMIFDKLICKTSIGFLKEKTK